MGERIERRALITGVAGQDGSYMAEFLLGKKYEVFGTVREKGDDEANIIHIKAKLNLLKADLMDNESLKNALLTAKPDEIYHFAGVTSPTDSFRKKDLYLAINAKGTIEFMHMVKMGFPKARFFQASTAAMLDVSRESPQKEKTPFKITSPYAESKIIAHKEALNLRENGMFISCGILYNHESERRPLTFLPQKIAFAAACAELGIKNSEETIDGTPIVKNGITEIGDLSVKRDWGYAKDFVYAMWLTLQSDKPDDFIIATGESHTVQELCEVAFSYVAKDWKKYIKVSEKFFRNEGGKPLVGDISKIKKVLGWKPKTSFKDLISSMVEANLKRLTL